MSLCVSIWWKYGEEKERATMTSEATRGEGREEKTRPLLYVGQRDDTMSADRIVLPKFHGSHHSKGRLVCKGFDLVRGAYASRPVPRLAFPLLVGGA
jgi:hypothetical protein